jgi:hypothetical protein
VDFLKDGLTQEETISIFYQRTQIGWRKNFIYTLQVSPNRVKQVTKCHALQVKTVVENQKSLEMLLAFLN